MHTFKNNMHTHTHDNQLHIIILFTIKVYTSNIGFHYFDETCTSFVLY